MINLVFEDMPMKGMASMGPDLLPPLVTWVWLIALVVILVFHCGHWVRMGGQHRWFHASHILMLVSMLYMYAGMELKWKWFPKSWWVAIFWLSTAAIVGWMILRLVQRRPFSFLWIIALISQASMIYMWMPSWAPALTWALVVYFTLETVAWLGGLLDDSKRRAMASGGSTVFEPVTPAPAAGTAAKPTRPASASVGVLDGVRPQRTGSRKGGFLLGKDVCHREVSRMSDTDFRPGLEGVIAFESKIAEPDRAGGALRYRGVDINDLVGRVPYGHVWGLLVDNEFNPGLPPAEPFPLPVHTGDVRVDVKGVLDKGRSCSTSPRCPLRCSPRCSPVPARQGSQPTFSSRIARGA